MFDFKIKIAGIIIGIQSPRLRLKQALFKENFEGFSYFGRSKPDVCLRINSGRAPVYQERNVYFSYQDRLKVFACKQMHCHLYLNSPDVNTRQLVEINKDMNEIAYYQQVNGADSRRRLLFDIKHGFLQNFLRAYLARYKKGFLLHAACVKDNHSTYLFAGKSKTGKSTMAKIWQQTAKSRVFNDDRAIIRTENGGVYFYNLPWWGTHNKGYRPSCRDRLKVNKIFFISHKNKNMLKPLSWKKASARLFQNTFLPLWDAQGMTESLALSAKIARTVPCYSLGFVNDKQIVRFLREYAHG